MMRALFAIASALVVASFSQPSVDRAAAIDALMTREMRDLRIPGAAIAVVENGAPVFQRAYGVSNLETGTPMTTDAVFELASVTKQFTAAAVMMLVGEGKVRLDDRVTAYVNHTPPAWERITIRHLLTHTSGLASLAVPAPLLDIKTPQVFEFLTRQPLQFPTGQVGWYSDAGYFLLGMVIEKASGQTYREFLTRRVFEPLHMDRASITDRRRVLKGRVTTYALRNGEYQNWRRDWDYELPAFFGIWSTLSDLAAWDAGLRQATLLAPPALAQIWTPGTLDNGQRARVLDHFYGFGWELANLRGHRTVGHEGASGSYILRFVDEPLTIIVLTNLDAQSGGGHPRLLAHSIAGTVRPLYQPPHMLAPQADPDPQATARIQSLLADIGAGRVPSIMSSAYRAWYAGDPGARAWYGRQLGGADSLTFLARDEMAGASLWGGEPIDRLVHYAVGVKGRTTYLTAGITQSGDVESLDFYRR
jgi:D-alanyl-D-alanine carboxypeptidase